MRKFTFLWTICMILAFQMGPLTDAQADVVGRLTQVEGRVDLLKGGQLPATPVKVDDGVQTGDVVRTKSLSKAQITFIDNSTLTVSPESRVGIEAYMFDPAQNKRNAVIQLFQGLAHVVVNRVFKSAEPDFVVKTHTAIMGVRGTEFGIRLHPNSSTILNFEGVLQVGNIFPEVGQLSRRAFKLAYSFGPPGSHNSVLLRNMQGTSVGKGMTPTMPYTLSPEDRKAFMRQLVADLISRKGGGDTGGGEGGAATPGGAITGYAGSTGQQGSDTPGGNLGSLFAYFFQTAFSNSTTYTPPPDRPPIETPASNPNNPVIPPTPPTPPTYNFTLATYGGFLQSAAASPVLITSAGLAVLQGDWGNALPRLYTATDSSTFAPTSGAFPSRKVLGVYTTTMVGSVSGVLGSSNPLTGSATVNSSYVSLRYTLSNLATIQVTIDQFGQISYSYTGGGFTSSAISGASSGNGTASPLIASIPAPPETMTVMAASTSSTVVTNNNQLGSNLAPVNPGDSHGSLAGAARTRPMTGLRQGATPEPAIPNINLTSAITRPTAHFSPNLPGKAGTPLGGVAAPQVDPQAGIAQAVHRRKHKPAGTMNIGQSSRGNAVHNGANPSPQGGAPSTH